MNFSIFSTTNAETLGWTLLHSIWQFAVLGLTLAGTTRILRETSPNTRYIAALCALGLTFALPAFTFVQIRESYSGSRTTAADERFEDPVRQSGFSDVNGMTPAKDVAGASIARVTGSSDVAADLRAFIAARVPELLPFAVAGWLLGVAVFSLRFAGGAWHIRDLRRHNNEPLGEEWRTRFASLAERLGVNPSIDVVISHVLQTPVAIGVLRPMILVPAGLFLQMDPKQLESLIAHEFVHIRRHDQLVSLIQGLAETLFFYHPCVWWISTQLRAEREFAADAGVIKAFAHDRLGYATALANLEEIRLRANSDSAPTLAAAADGGNFVQRIERILQNKTELKSAGSAWQAGMALALISALLLAVFSLNPNSLVNAQKPTRGDKKIAIGFVSIPPIDRGSDPPKDSDATARLLIAKLQQYKVPAIGFLTGSAVSDGEKLYPVRANIVRMWRDAGLEIGIGGFKHIWFYETPFEEYVAGVEKNEAVAKRLLDEKGLDLRYFSYPYLNTGKSVEDRDRFESWLAGRGLTSLKYTVDNQEWTYSYAYDVARQDNDINTMNDVRVSFVRYMDRMMDHYEAYSQEIFGHEIAQTMVLTPSRLVTDSADELFGMLQRRGYKFVPVDEAQADAAYRTPEHMVGKFGNSWFERWTYSQGRKLRDEPNVDAVASEIWKKRKPAH